MADKTADRITADVKEANRLRCQPYINTMDAERCYAFNDGVEALYRALRDAGIIE